MPITVGCCPGGAVDRRLATTSWHLTGGARIAAGQHARRQPTRPSCGSSSILRPVKRTTRLRTHAPPLPRPARSHGRQRASAIDGADEAGQADGRTRRAAVWPVCFWTLRRSHPRLQERGAGSRHAADLRGPSGARRTAGRGRTAGRPDRADAVPASSAPRRPPWPPPPPPARLRAFPRSSVPLNIRLVSRPCRVASGSRSSRRAWVFARSTWRRSGRAAQHLRRSARDLDPRTGRQPDLNGAAVAVGRHAARALHGRHA